jgi:hypothetical protein
VQPSGFAAASLLLGGGSSNVEGSAEAEYGILRSFANAQLDYSMGTSPATVVDALSGFRDIVTITSPDLINGSQAFVRYRVVLEGAGFGAGNTLPSNFPSVGGYMLSVGYFGTISSNEIYTDLFAGVSEVVDLDFTDTAQVVLGEAMEFQVQLIATATVGQPSEPGSYEAEMNLGSTFNWGGIVEATDTLGNPIDFAVASNSGVDWAQPVPEPDADVLAVSVLAGVAILATRRRGLR